MPTPSTNPTTGPATMPAHPMTEQHAQWTRELRAEALSRRARRLAELKTPDDVAAWARELRAWYRARVGPRVELAGPMKREHAGTIVRDGYRVEKWLYEVMPGTLTAANLYIPDRPNPDGVAIVAPLGHWPLGKATEDYLNLGAYMAYNGIPVLVYDHPGVGERREYWNPVRGESRTGKGVTTEHDRTGDVAALAGIQPSQLYLTEVARAVEFLAGFDFVRRDRIGLTGASGGGTLSRFGAVYLDDIAFTIPVCIIRGEIIGGGDAEQNCWSSGPQAVAAVDFLATMAPRPVMIVTERLKDGSDVSYATLRRIYNAAGAPAGATEYFAIEDKHGYGKEMIEAVYAFLARNYKLAPAAADTWSKVRPLTQQEAEITPTGFLIRHRAQVTLLEQIARLAPPPPKEKLTRARLAEALQISDWKRAPLKYAFVPAEPHDSSIRITGATAAGPGELGLLDWPPRPARDPELDIGDNWLYRADEPNAARFLFAFDRSLVGLRTRQILDFLEDHKGQVKHLEASGPWSVPLAFAAALAGPDLLPSATVHQLPARFRDALTAEVNTTGLSAYPPGFLLYGDIDDVVALAGARLKVEGRTNPDGRVIAP